jgi:mRNA interferase MazF
LKRGSIVIAGEKGPFSGKPRPWLVIQRTRFLDPASSVTVCAISASAHEAEFRIPLLPSKQNGLEQASRILVDKLLTVRGDSIEREIGVADETTMARVDEALRLWLDL